MRIVYKREFGGEWCVNFMEELLPGDCHWIFTLPRVVGGGGGGTCLIASQQLDCPGENLNEIKTRHRVESGKGLRHLNFNYSNRLSLFQLRSSVSFPATCTHTLPRGKKQ